MQGVTAKGYGASFWGALKLIVVMVLQLCDYTENQCLVYFQWVNL